MSYQRKHKPYKAILDTLPKKPHPRQAEFLRLVCEEALFGGATGGGKTEALLMWLAEGYDIPGYTGAIFRRYETDLVEGNNSILAKSMALYPALGGKLIGMEWVFPSGASIVMSGLAFDKSVLSAQGKEFHRVAFDEITHFTEAQYEFIYTNRIRKVVGFPILCGVRVAGNPGGPGHGWVVNRFLIREAIETVRKLSIYERTPSGMEFWKTSEVCYLPSRAADNPSLDIEDYFHRQLKNKNPVERARMMNGDWGISPEGLIKPNWLRYYSMQGRNVQLLKSYVEAHEVTHTSEVLLAFHEGECRRFMTVDTAGGMKQITREAKGKELSWTVVGVWDHYRKGNVRALLCRHIWRDRLGFTEVARNLLRLQEQWQPTRTRIENATMGPHLYDMLSGKMPIEVIDPSGGHKGKSGKVERATQLLNMMEQGEVYLPVGENTWRPTLESEWLSWQGLEEETNDQVDVAAYAAIECGGYGTGTIKLVHDPRKPLVEQTKGDLMRWF